MNSSSSSSRRRTQRCPVPGYRCKRRTRCNKTKRRCSISSEPIRRFPRRCINGSRRQKNGEGCAETDSTKYERCKNGTRRHKRTKECDAGVVHLFKNRKRILARGQQLRGHTDNKSRNSAAKNHKRFSFAPDAPGAAKYRKQRLKDYAAAKEEEEEEEWDGPPSPVPSPKPKSPRRPNENLADPFKIRARKSSPPPPRELSVDDNDDDYPTNDNDMGEFAQDDYAHEEGNDNDNAVVEENRRQLSPIPEEEEELSPPPFVRRKTPKIQNKTPNTRSSSQRTRSETARNRVNYGFKNSSKRGRPKNNSFNT